MKNYLIYGVIGLFVFAGGIYTNKMFSSVTNDLSTLQPGEMSAGQLLDQQLELEKQIAIMEYNKKEIQELRNEKTAAIRKGTGTVATGIEQTPIESVDSFIQNQ